MKYRRGVLFVLMGLFLVLLPEFAMAGLGESSTTEKKDGFTTALNELKSRATNGDVVAQYKLGLLYFNGYGVVQDHKEALKWYRLAADRGYALAQFSIGYLYDHIDYNRATNESDSEEEINDKNEAFKWYQLAAGQGLALAQNNLGVKFYKESRDNIEVTLKWLKLAADQGCAVAQDNLGEIYYVGCHKRENVGSEQPDYREALRCYRLAASNGDAIAQAKLGDMYFDGHGVPADYKEAVKWYRLAADQGNAIAQHALSGMYKMGWGVSRNSNKAEELAILVEEQSGDYGVHEYGLLDFQKERECIPQDYNEALTWNILAADKGDARAQYNIGFMYDNGGGLSPDFKKAMKWYRLAADQEFALAQYKLGMMYALGKGVSSSIIVTYATWSISGVNNTSRYENPANSKINYLRMSKKEIEAGQALAREMSKPGNFLKALDTYMQKNNKAKKKKK